MDDDEVIELTDAIRRAKARREALPQPYMLSPVERDLAELVADDDPDTPGAA